MDGDLEIQERIANKNLGWLRRLCIEVQNAGRLGEELRASGLGSISISANMDSPGVLAANPAEERQVAKAIGTVMGAVFRTAIGNRVAYEGFEVTRDIRRVAAESPGSGTDDCKFYCIRRIEQLAGGDNPADGVPPEPGGQGAERENTPCCGPQPSEIQCFT